MPVTGQGTPYVVATDVVGAYPEISRQLADAIDAKNTAQDNTAAGLRTDVNNTNARTAGLERVANGMRFATGTNEGAYSVEPSNGSGVLMQSYGGESQLWHRHNGNWHMFLRAYWATAGNNEMFVQSGVEWNLNNPRNFFAGTFFPAGTQAAQQPEVLRTTDDTPEGCYDLNATLVAMAERIEQLEARITQLEAQA